MNSRPLALLFAVSLLFGGAINTATADSMDDEDEMLAPVLYSLHGKVMYRDAASGLMCLDVYTGAGGTQDGALDFAKGEIQKYAKKHKYKSYSVIMTENITPSKYTFYVSFK